MHVNACGGNHWTRRELDEAAVGRADTVVVDSIDEAKRYGGNLVFPIETGVIHWGQVSELWEVASGRVAGRPSADDGDALRGARHRHQRRGGGGVRVPEGGGARAGDGAAAERVAGRAWPSPQPSP